MSRNDQYRQLIADVRTAYQSGQRELKWCDECQEVNLWNYWQGHGHLDARIMLVGQDWGCPWDAGAAAVMRNIQAMNCGQSVSYMCENENPTDRNLIELFHSIGFDILTDDSRLFFTNFVMGYRVKGASGNFKKSWAAADAEYFRRLVEIIRPRILLCLGKDTWKSVLGCFGGTISNKMSYNRVIESEKNPVVVKLSDGMPVYVFALAHCGVMGTLNRNRGSGDKLLLSRQKNDWARVLPVFWSDPLLLNTYWEPSIKMLREIEASEEKRSWCKAYSVYAPQTDKQGLIRTFRQFMNDTYKNGVVIGNYREMMNRLNLDDQQVVKAESAWVDTLSLYGAVACLAYHFRRDHFCEGSLINDSVANGCVLRLMERIYKLLVAMP